MGLTPTGRSRAAAPPPAEPLPRDEASLLKTWEVHVDRSLATDGAGPFGRSQAQQVKAVGKEVISFAFHTWEGRGDDPIGAAAADAVGCAAAYVDTKSNIPKAAKPLYEKIATETLTWLTTYNNVSEALSLPLPASPPQQELTPPRAVHIVDPRNPFGHIDKKKMIPALWNEAKKTE